MGRRGMCHTPALAEAGPLIVDILSKPKPIVKDFAMTGRLIENQLGEGFLPDDTRLEFCMERYPPAEDVAVHQERRQQTIFAPRLSKWNQAVHFYASYTLVLEVERYWRAVKVGVGFLNLESSPINHKPRISSP